ncbi:hypothetical protein [Spirosoma sp.]|nr:hypothetical protein [Spirosoma sp.]
MAQKIPLPRQGLDHHQGIDWYNAGVIPFGHRWPYGFEEWAT